MGSSRRIFSVDLDAVLRLEGGGDLRRAYGAEELAVLARLGAHLDREVAHFAGELPGALPLHFEAVGVRAFLDGGGVDAARVRGQREPSGYEEIARVAVADGDDLARLALILHVFLEYDLHSISTSLR